MNERELLEKASIAVGIKGRYNTETLCVNGDWIDVTAIFLDNDMGYWNPLVDDGDAFRMECKLGLEVIWYSDYVVAAETTKFNRPQAPHENMHVGKVNVFYRIYFADKDGDKAKSRRYASTIIAASIGDKQ